MTTTSLILEHLFHRDESPEQVIYVQFGAPELDNGDIWHCLKSHRTYMSVVGAKDHDPGFNSWVELTAFDDCSKYNCVSVSVSAPPSEPCNSLCMTGHDIGVSSSEIAYAHPECRAHGDCSGRCSPPVYYDVDCPLHGRKPSQTPHHTVGTVPPMAANEGDTWYQPQTLSQYVRKGINWVRVK